MAFPGVRATANGTRIPGPRHRRNALATGPRRSAANGKGRIRPSCDWREGPRRILKQAFARRLHKLSGSYVTAALRDHAARAGPSPLRVADRRREKNPPFSRLHDFPKRSSAIDDALDTNCNPEKISRLILGHKLVPGQEYRLRARPTKKARTHWCPARFRREVNDNDSAGGMGVL
jgi:hypothetical protein